MSKRTLHAVLTGINAYPPPVTPLHGCLADVGAWEAYLRDQKEDFDVRISILKDAKATKAAIAGAWQKSLTTAKKGDVVLLFYSGHGTRESADPVFSALEADNALECLVCYDSVRYARGDFEYDLLSDKEIHYLISTYGKDGVHLLTVFDSCHSGGVTRNMFLSEEAALERRYIPAERLSFTAPMRRWNKFLFSDKVTRSDVEHRGWLNAIPQGRHITLSACQDDESAFEYEGKGVFTKNIVEVLQRTRGALTYFDLLARVRSMVQHQFSQTPEIYAIRGFEDDLLQGFLETPVTKKEFQCTCSYDKSKGWVVDLGAIQGMSQYSGTIEITEGKHTYTANIGKVYPRSTVIQFTHETEKQLDQAVAYSAAIKGFIGGNTTFFIAADKNDGMMDSLRKELIKWISENTAPFTLVDQRSQAQYVIRAEGQYILLCHNDDHLRPVTEFERAAPDQADLLLQYLRHIAQWEYIRTLSNPGYTGQTYPVEITVYRKLKDGSRKEIPVVRDTIEFDFDKQDDGSFGGYLQVKITNRSDSKYYCAILYLSNSYEIYGNMLDGKVIGVDRNQSAWVLNGADIELELEKQVTDFNYRYSEFYLKLMAHTEPFLVDAIEQSPLPAPVHGQTRGAAEATSKGIKTRQEKPVEAVNWFTHTLCFKGRNPQYKE